MAALNSKLEATQGKKIVPLHEIDRVAQEIQQLQSGDVAVLKGELWAGNENAGLVHRSPAVGSGANRLLLSMDFCD